MFYRYFSTQNMMLNTNTISHSNDNISNSQQIRNNNGKYNENFSRKMSTERIFEKGKKVGNSYDFES